MDKEDRILYDDGHTIVTRDMIKTLGSNKFIYIEIIDAWAFILSRKSIKENDKRIFFSNNAFNMLCQDDAYIDDTQEITPEIRLDKFMETLDYWIADCCIQSLKGVQLFFFLVYAYHHFYVLVINTKSKSIEVIDNRPLLENVEFSSKYHDWPEQI
ncbi:Peptidase T, partial [Bienertia sinuspersici]